MQREKIYTLQELIKEKLNKKGVPNKNIYENHSGIYVWGVKSKNKYYPMYVGMAKNITERLFQHVTGFFGGIYPIPDYETITNTKRNISELKKIAEKGNQLPEGLLYYPIGDFGVFDGKQFENQDSSKIRKTIQKVKESMFFAWVDVPNYSTELGKQLEGNLAHHIGCQKLIGTRYKKSDGKMNLIQPLIKLEFQ